MMRFVEQYLDPIFGGPRSHQITLWSMCVLVVFALFWVVLLSPQLNTIRDLKQEIATSADALQREAQVQKQLKELEVRFAKLTSTEQQIAARIPVASDVDGLLTTISESAREAGLELRSFERQLTDSKEFVVEVPVRVSVSGYYHQLATFLDEIRRLPQLVVVTRFVIKDPKPEGDKVLISAECVLTAFNAAPPQEKRPVGKKVK